MMAAVTRNLYFGMDADGPVWPETADMGAACLGDAVVGPFGMLDAVETALGRRDPIRSRERHRNEAHPDTEPEDRERAKQIDPVIPSEGEKRHPKETTSGDRRTDDELPPRPDTSDEQRCE